MALKDVLQPKTELDEYFSNYKIKVSYKKLCYGDYDKQHFVKYNQTFTFFGFKWQWWVYIDKKFKPSYFKGISYSEERCKNIIKSHVEKILQDIEKSKRIKPQNEEIKVNKEYIFDDMADEIDDGEDDYNVADYEGPWNEKEDDDEDVKEYRQRMVDLIRKNTTEPI